MCYYLHCRHVLCAASVHRDVPIRQLLNVMLVTKHGVVRHQGDHDHVLGEDDEHEQQDSQQHPPRRSPPGPDSVHQETQAADANVGDPRHGAGQEEEHHQRVDYVIQRKHLLGKD